MIDGTTTIRSTTSGDRRLDRRAILGGAAGAAAAGLATRLLSQGTSMLLHGDEPRAGDRRRAIRRSVAAPCRRAFASLCRGERQVPHTAA